MLLSAGHIEDALISLKLADRSPNYFATIGCHPCRAKEATKMGVEKYKLKVESIIDGLKDKSKLVAIGECGLDYDRFHYADKETQLAAFPFHFDLAEKYNLPMYLHSRSCKDDFLKIMRENRHKFSTGVVHSYTGDEDELNALIEMGLYIGVNGCSLKTQENVDIVKKIPLDRIMLETDCPYCEIRSTHVTHGDIKTKFTQ